MLRWRTGGNCIASHSSATGAGVTGSSCTGMNMGGTGCNVTSAGIEAARSCTGALIDAKVAGARFDRLAAGVRATLGPVSGGRRHMFHLLGMGDRGPG